MRECVNACVRMVCACDCGVCLDFGVNEVFRALVCVWVWWCHTR